MDFLDKLKAKLKAKGANAWTEEELNELFADDGEFVTDITNHVASCVSTETEGLIKKNKELLSEKKKIQDKLRAGATEDISEYEEKIDELSQANTELNEKLSKIQKDQEKVSKNWLAEKEKLLNQLKSEKSGYNELLIENELNAGLASITLASPAQLPAVKKHLRDTLILVEDGDKRKVVARHIDADGKEAQMGFKDYVEKIWAPSDEGKAFIVSKASGSGANKGARGSDDTHSEDPAANESPFAAAFS